jgi:hypothetical protein
MPEQADGRQQNSRARGELKKQTRRQERRKAKKNPETDPGYRRFRGYLT